MYLAFDPGETTGLAEFDHYGELVFKDQLRFNDLVDYCRDYDKVLHAVIVEDFKILGPKAKSFIGNRMETIQAIGVIRAMALQRNCEYVLQDRGIKGIAVKLTGLKPVGPHSQSHWIDAYNHGCYYLIRQGIRKPELERRGSNEAVD